MFEVVILTKDYRDLTRYFDSKKEAEIYYNTNCNKSDVWDMYLQIRRCGKVTQLKHFNCVNEAVGHYYKPALNWLER